MEERVIFWILLLAPWIYYHTWPRHAIHASLFITGAVRFTRKIIGMKDEFYNRHIVSSNLFAPIVDTYIKNNSRYNLLDSAILEIFEFIKLVSLTSNMFSLTCTNTDYC